MGDIGDNWREAKEYRAKKNREREEKQTTVDYSKGKITTTKPLYDDNFEIEF